MDSGEDALVAAAASGDPDAFRRLIEPLRGELHRFCYRMMGSFHDAEDVLQDAEVKVWQALPEYRRRGRFRTWLYRVVTNTALDALRSRRRRVLPQDLGGPRDPATGLGEQTHEVPWLSPHPGVGARVGPGLGRAANADAIPETGPGTSSAGLDPHHTMELRESVRLAFVRALQRLPPRQRAVLILREVLDWSAREVAEALDTSVAAVNSALQRARSNVTDEPERTWAIEPDELGRRKVELADRYVRAWETGDIDAVVAMLTEDATHAMPPWPSWFEGRETLRTVYAGYPVWQGRPGPDVFRVIPVGLNADLGFAEYCREAPGKPFAALALTLATLNDSATAMTEKVSFVSPELFPRFGPPEVLD